MIGSYDYMLSVVICNFVSYDWFIKEKLGDIEIVVKVDIIIVLN